MESMLDRHFRGAAHGDPPLPGWAPDRDGLLTGPPESQVRRRDNRCPSPAEGHQSGWIEFELSTDNKSGSFPPQESGLSPAEANGSFPTEANGSPPHHESRLSLAEANGSPPHHESRLSPAPPHHESGLSPAEANGSFPPEANGTILERADGRALHAGKDNGPFLRAYIEPPAGGRVGGVPLESARREAETESAGPRSQARMKVMMKEAKQRCVTCGDNSMCEGEVSLTREIGEHVFSATTKGLVCTTCGESIADVLAGERFDLAVAEILSEASPTGDAFRFLRKVAGLRARDLARMLGVTGDTISRWENGKHPVDRAAFFVLGKVAREKCAGSTAMLDLLVRGELPRALPRIVTVHLD